MYTQPFKTVIYISMQCSWLIQYTQVMNITDCLATWIVNLSSILGDICEGQILSGCNMNKMQNKKNVYFFISCINVKIIAVEKRNASINIKPSMKWNWLYSTFQSLHYMQNNEEVSRLVHWLNYSVQSHIVIIHEKLPPKNVEIMHIHKTPQMNGPHVNKMFKSIIHYTIFIFQSKNFNCYMMRADASEPVEDFMTITDNSKHEGWPPYVLQQKYINTSNSVK